MGEGGWEEGAEDRQALGVQFPGLPTIQQQGVSYVYWINAMKRLMFMRTYIRTHAGAVLRCRYVLTTSYMTYSQC